MTYFVFEKNIFMEGFVNRFKSLLIEKGKGFSEVEILPFSHEMIGPAPIIPEGTNVIFFGSIGGSKVAKEQGWKVWDKNFGVSEYKKLGHLFLNNDATISKFSEVDVERLPDLFFLRPESDNKEFAGTLIEKDNFVAWRDNLIKIGYLDNTDFLVSVSCPKELNREIRCVVKNGELITASEYRTKYSKKYKQIKYGSTDFEMFKNGVKELAEIYEPDEIYVIDFGEISEDCYRVIEYNCFNSAGLYDCDEQRIYDMFYGDE